MRKTIAILASLLVAGSITLAAPASADTDRFVEHRYSCEDGIETRYITVGTDWMGLDTWEEGQWFYAGPLTPTLVQRLDCEVELVNVTGSRRHGFTLTYNDGTTTHEPRMRRALRECRDENTRSDRRECRRDVRAEYRHLVDLKRSL